MRFSQTRSENLKDTNFNKFCTLLNLKKSTKNCTFQESTIYCTFKKNTHFLLEKLYLIEKIQKKFTFNNFYRMKIYI